MGTLTVRGSTSGQVQLSVPATVSPNITYVLPGTDGQLNQVLRTDGAGNLSFGFVTSGNYGNAAFDHANSGFIQANSAFIRANNSLDANNGGDVFGIVSFYSNILGYNGTANLNHLHVQQPYIYVNAGGQSPVSGRMNIVFQRGSSYVGVPNAVISFNETSNTFQMTNGSGVFSNIAFEPYTGANLSTDLWATTAPATLQAAIERLANAVIVLRGYSPIP